MIAVTDTAPINYLIQLDMEDILPRMFEVVLIPEEVIGELLNAKAPEKVRNRALEWKSSTPVWMKIAAAGASIATTGRIHVGEQAAMTLAESQMPCVLLMDDREALIEAARRGLVTARLLALLFDAGRLGLLEFRETLGHLEKTTFRMSAEVKEHFLRRWDTR